jgi:hypothetical protein
MNHLKLGITYRLVHQEKHRSMTRSGRYVTERCLRRQEGRYHVKSNDFFVSPYNIITLLLHIDLLTLCTLMSGRVSCYSAI